MKIPSQFQGKASPTPMPAGSLGSTEPAGPCSAARGEQRFRSTAECPIRIVVPAAALLLGSEAPELDGEIPISPGPGHPPGRSRGSRRSGEGHGRDKARPQFQLTALRQETLIKGKNMTWLLMVI